MVKQLEKLERKQLSPWVFKEVVCIEKGRLVFGKLRGYPQCNTFSLIQKIPFPLIELNTPFLEFSLSFQCFVILGIRASSTYHQEGVEAWKDLATRREANNNSNRGGQEWKWWLEIEWKATLVAVFVFRSFVSTTTEVNILSQSQEILLIG